VHLPSEQVQVILVDNGRVIFELDGSAIALTGKLFPYELLGILRELDFMEVRHESFVHIIPTVYVEVRIESHGYVIGSPVNVLAFNFDFGPSGVETGLMASLDDEI
jgi:hypothetical protein